MFNFLACQIPGPIFCTPASLGHASVTSMSIGNLQYILLHNIHNLLCDLILKHESTRPEFVWGFQCSLLGSKIHYLGQEKSNSLHGSTQVVNIHYLGQIHNLGQNMCVKIFHFKCAYIGQPVSEISEFLTVYIHKCTVKTIVSYNASY